MDICWERADLLAFRLCCITLCRLECFFLSRMVSGAGSGIRLYRLLIIAFSSPFNIYDLSSLNYILLDVLLTKFD